MYNFRANIAVLMNITLDHLDRYDHCMQNYIDAKFRITQKDVYKRQPLKYARHPLVYLVEAADDICYQKIGRASCRERV